MLGWGARLIHVSHSCSKFSTHCRLALGTTFGPEDPFEAEDLLARAAMDWGAFRRTEVYAEFLRPRGIVGMLGAHLPLGERAFAALGFYRRAEDPWDAAQRRLLRALLPHLHRALQIGVRLDVLGSRLEATREVLDRLDCGAFLVDEDGRVLECNRPARDLAAEGDGLRVTRESITATAPGVTRRLRDLVRGAARSGAGRPGSAGGALALERPSGRRPLQLLVSPLPRRGTADRWGLAASALVLVSDPERTPLAPEELLRAFFGLTPAEARVARELAAGRDLDEIGAALGIRRETVRNHLKRIYEKTDTRRQAELVRLVHTLPTSPRDATP